MAQKFLDTVFVLLNSKCIVILAPLCVQDVDKEEVLDKEQEIEFC